MRAFLYSRVRMRLNKRGQPECESAPSLARQRVPVNANWRGILGSMESAAKLAAVRRGFELFHAGDLDTLFAEVFHPDVDYSGDAEVSTLAGYPPEAHGTAGVRSVWEAFFAMFDEVHLSEVELISGEGDSVFGRAHMLTRGGVSEVPIDAPFYFAWELRDGRWRFMSAKLDQDEAAAALHEWCEGERPA
jgi:ketosteroid isomerase-like protein